MIAVALAYGWIQGEALQTSYRSARLHKENEKMRALVSAAKVELSALTAPSLIDQEAHQLGFIRYDEGVELVEAVSSQPGRMLLADNSRSR